MDPMSHEEQETQKNQCIPRTKSKKFLKSQRTKICIGTTTGLTSGKAANTRVSGKNRPLIMPKLEILSQVRNGEVLEPSSMKMDPNIKAKPRMENSKVRVEKLR